MNFQEILEWLLKGDVSIQYQTYRDLLNEERPEIREKIEKEGWGSQFLLLQRPDGHWGREFYQPKWTSTHYTLLDLKNLEISKEQKQIRNIITTIVVENKAADGGIDPGKTITQSDVCINGMFLNYACYFGILQAELHSVVDFILGQKMSDGGFNCRSNRSGAVHSSLHTTLSILEGIIEYELNGYKYRLDELKKAQAESIEFILQHKLFRSCRTGTIINKKFLMLSYPSRWKYDILRALDFYQYARIPYDPRIQDALDVLILKRRSDNTWPLQAKHPGHTHFDMERSGNASRWNTLRALRVLKHFGMI